MTAILFILYRQLGELNEWSKKTNTELATHVPLLISA